MYGTVSDVQALIPEFTITTTSKPSEAEVEDLLAEASALVDGVLAAQGYTTPVTGGTDTRLVTGMVTKRVAAQVLLVAFPGDNAPEKAKFWLEDFEKFLSRLRRGEQQLVDQALAGDTVGLFKIVRTPSRDAFFSARGNTTDWDE